MPHPNSPPALSRNSSTLSNRSGSSNYRKVELQPRNVGNRPPSITLQPLPPIPPPEPLYDELKFKGKGNLKFLNFVVFMGCNKGKRA